MRITTAEIQKDAGKKRWYQKREEAEINLVAEFRLSVTDEDLGQTNTVLVAHQMELMKEIFDWDFDFEKGVEEFRMPLTG